MADEVPDAFPVPAGLRVCLRTSNGAFVEKRRNEWNENLLKSLVYIRVFNIYIYIYFYRSIIDVDKCGIYCLFCFFGLD